MKETSKSMELMEPVSPEAFLPSIGLWPWFAAAAALILLGIILYLILRPRPAKVDPTSARLAAYREAIASLDSDSPSDSRDAAIRGSLVLRRYLSLAANDPALFETHEEFVIRHQALAELNPQVREAAQTAFSKLATMKYGPDTPDTDPRGIIHESKQLLETLHHGFAA